jgi:hypothetical protein
MPELSSGIYIAQLETDDAVISRKVVLTAKD